MGQCWGADRFDVNVESDSVGMDSFGPFLTPRSAFEVLGFDIMVMIL